MIIVLSAHKLAEALLNVIKRNEHFERNEHLDDINIYQINIVSSARKLTEASLDVIGQN